MRRRRLSLALAGLIVLSIVTIALWPWPDRATRENYDRIEVGMTRAEVVALLGPSGDYTTRRLSLDPRVFAELNPEEWKITENHKREEWFGDGGLLGVQYDSDSRVRAAIYMGVWWEKRTRLENLLWRAKRQWRKWFPE
jgi:hypothetical protein